MLFRRRQITFSITGNFRSAAKKIVRVYNEKPEKPDTHN
jgi:hypothetical protein